MHNVEYNSIRGLSSKVEVSAPNMPNECTTLNTIPFEVFCLIFSYLDVTTALCWRLVVSNISVPPQSRIPLTGRPCYTSRSLIKVDSLRIFRDYYYVTRIFNVPDKPKRYIHTLSMAHIPCGDQPSTLSALGECSSLHTLVLYGCSGLRDISGLGECRSLHTLDLNSCYGLSDISALGGCGSLHTLHLTTCSGLSDISALGGCGSLHTLLLMYCDNLHIIDPLGGCGSLHTLYLIDCNQVKDISALGQCTALHTLELNDCKGVSGISALGGCSSLCMLTINGCGDIADISTLMRDGRTIHLDGWTY